MIKEIDLNAIHTKIYIEVRRPYINKILCDVSYSIYSLPWDTITIFIYNSIRKR